MQIACLVLVGLTLGPGTIFQFLGIIGSLAVIVLCILANAALTVFVWQRHRPEFSVWSHAMAPYSFLGLMAMWTLQSRRPEALARDLPQVSR